MGVAVEVILIVLEASGDPQQPCSHHHQHQHQHHHQHHHHYHCHHYQPLIYLLTIESELREGHIFVQRIEIMGIDGSDEVAQ